MADTQDTVETFIDPADFAEDTRFSEATLSEELERQASLIAHYGVALGKAQHQSDRFKHRLEIKTAQVAKRMRDEANDEGRKITEKQIELDLSLSPTVIKARANYNEAKAVHETLKVALEALRHKRDAMIQAGVTRRLEVEMQTRISGRVDDAESRDRDAKDAIRRRANPASA